MNLKQVLAGLVTAAALAGCGAAATTPTPTSSASGAMGEAQFVERARLISGFETTAADKLSAAGQAMCKLYNPSAGGEPETLFGAAVNIGQGSGMTAEESGRFLYLAVSTYCPQESAYLPTA